jgi:hypothetical protein
MSQVLEAEQFRFRIAPVPGRLAQEPPRQKATVLPPAIDAN